MKSFPDDYKSFSYKFSNTAPGLRDFIDFRRFARPDQPFNTKDSVMQAGRGCRRCHLVHGKVILVYKLVGPQLQLLALFEHDDIESYATMDRLRDQAAAMQQDDFQPYVQPEIVQAQPTQAPPRRRPVAKRPQVAIFNIEAHRRARDEAERRIFAAAANYVPRQSNGQPWATDEDMFDLMSKPRVEIVPVEESAAQTRNRAWAHCVLRMRANNVEWSMIRTTMRARYLSEPDFRCTVVARYKAASVQERTRLRGLLLSTVARAEAKAAADEARRTEIRATISAMYPPRPEPATTPETGASPAALREAILRCEELGQSVADLTVQSADQSNRLAAAAHRIAQLEAEVAEEREGRAAMLLASQASSRPASQAMEVLVAEAKLARNLAMHAKDQAEEARDAEREASRAALSRMRAAETALATERAIKSAAQRACSDALASVAKLEALVPAAGDASLLEQERAERKRLEGMLDTAVARIEFLESSGGVVHAVVAAPVEVETTDTVVPAQEPVVDEPLVNVGQRLFRARRDKGLTVDEVCRLVKVSPVMLSMWERDQLGVSRQYVARLSDVLSFDLYEFVAHRRVEQESMDARAALVTLPVAPPPPPVMERVEGDTIAQRIKLRRRARKLTQTELAKLAGVSGMSIFNWEAARVVPTASKLPKLAEALLLTPDMIMTGEGRPLELAPTGGKRGERRPRRNRIPAMGGKSVLPPWPVMDAIPAMETVQVWHAAGHGD